MRTGAGIHTAESIRERIWPTAFEQQKPVVMGPGSARAAGALVRDDIDFLLAAVDLAAHQRDRLLVDLRGVPFLDRGKIRLARLVAGTGAPAMRFQKIRGGGERVG